MRKIYYLLILFFSFSVLSAQEKLSKEEKARREKNIQAGNPFAKYGSKAPVATLSKGKYLEVHDLDSIVTIGTSRWHVDNKKIVGDIIVDSLNVDAQPIGDAPGRWMSPDPLSEEFPSWSPYNMCYNNPVKFVDPDGRAAIDVTPPDDYLISKTGAVSKIKETNDKFDRLYNEDKSKSITLTEGLVGQLANKRFGSEKNIEGGYFSSIGANSSQHEKDYQNLFKFASDNTLSEFSLTFFENKGKDWIQVSTFRDSGESPSPFTLGIGNPNKDVSRHYHSHPEISANRASEIFSIQGNTGDSDYGHSYYGNRTYPNYIYFPNSSKLYNVTPTSINYIKKINESQDLKTETK